MIEVKCIKSHRVIVPDFVKIGGLHNVLIYTPDKKRLLGRALVLESDDPTFQPILLDIYIYESFDKRQGVGTDLMHFLCTTFKSIVTSFLNDAGKNLCLKHGFTIEKHNGMEYLQCIRKDIKDAIEKGEIKESDRGEHKRAGSFGKTPKILIKW